MNNVTFEEPRFNGQEVNGNLPDGRVVSVGSGRIPELERQVTSIQEQVQPNIGEANYGIPPQMTDAALNYMGSETPLSMQTESPQIGETVEQPQPMASSVGEFVPPSAPMSDVNSTLVAPTLETPSVTPSTPQFQPEYVSALDAASNVVNPLENPLYVGGGNVNSSFIQQPPVSTFDQIPSVPPIDNVQANTTPQSETTNTLLSETPSFVSSSNIEPVVSDVKPYEKPINNSVDLDLKELEDKIVNLETEASKLLSEIVNIKNYLAEKNKDKSSEMDANIYGMPSSVNSSYLDNFPMAM